MEKVGGNRSWERAIAKLGEKGKDFQSFYNDVIRKPQFYFPFLVFSIMGYLPSIVNTKRQFEDFGLDAYLANDGLMKTGRWWMWLLGRSFSLPGNDIANKYLGFMFMVGGALLIVCSFYCLTDTGRMTKYTLTATTIVVFPLINEIWSYNGANLLVGMNTFYCGLVAYLLIQQGQRILKRLLLATVPFVLISSSYESGLFQYITLILSICTYVHMKKRLTIREYFSIGTYFAIPLLVGTGMGTAIGHLISLIEGIPYVKYGDTSLHWGSPNALAEVLVGNFDRYILRALIYVPIGVFVFAMIIWLCTLLLALIRKRGWLFVSLCFVFLSVFLLSVLQGSHLTYRSAQTVTVFTAFIFYLLMDWSEQRPKKVRQAISVLLAVICLMESSFLLKVNLIDYQNAHNDENIMRQLGYDLTTNYRGKKVVFAGRGYDLFNLSSKVLQQQIQVDTTTPNGKAYDTLIQELNGGTSAKGMKYFETNLWSVIYLISDDSSAMERFFSYCGYDIQVLSKADLADQYPETMQLIESREFLPLEILDVGDCVIVGL